MHGGAPYWVAAMTEPRREATAAHFLTIGGYDVYCPRTMSRAGGKTRITSLFPGYLFAVIGDNRWWSARWTRGVVSIVMSGDRPARLPVHIIAALKSREVGGLVILPQRPKFSPGDEVRVVAGPFRGLSGLYQGQSFS